MDTQIDTQYEMELELSRMEAECGAELDDLSPSHTPADRARRLLASEDPPRASDAVRCALIAHGGDDPRVRETYPVAFGRDSFIGHLGGVGAVICSPPEGDTDKWRVCAALPGTAYHTGRWPWCVIPGPTPERSTWQELGPRAWAAAQDTGTVSLSRLHWDTEEEVWEY